MFKIEDIENKNVLIRADLDIDAEEGDLSTNFRLQKLLPTLLKCLQKANKVCLIGHRGRPNGELGDKWSLKPVAEAIKRLINQDITFISSGLPPGEWWKGGNKLSILDNLRLDKREESLDREFANYLAAGADIYIYEAFATYRPCTSLSLLPEVLPTLTGDQFDLEVATLTSLIKNPDRPTLLIGSGAKEDKKALLDSLSLKFDQVFYGGAFAKKEDLLPSGLDINSEALNRLLLAIDQAQTIVLNGPLGRFEDGVNHVSTKAVLEKLKNSPKKVVLGGGDTLTAVQKLGFKYTQYGFVSTGGGGMLEFLDTLTHPLLAVLK